jgi:hypothetical protein
VDCVVNSAEAFVHDRNIIWNMMVQTRGKFSLGIIGLVIL